MIVSLLHFFAWAITLLLIAVTGLLATNRQIGLALIQHRVEMLPQAMLVRYAGLTLLAVVTVWFGAPRVLFGVLLCIAAIGFGDSFIYRRAGHPFWLHVTIGAAAIIGALLSLIAMN